MLTETVIVGLVICNSPLHVTAIPAIFISNCYALLLSMITLGFISLTVPVKSQRTPAIIAFGDAFSITILMFIPETSLISDGISRYAPDIYSPPLKCISMRLTNILDEVFRIIAIPAT